MTRDGVPVTLAVSAFDCLVYLVEHRERPVGKDELISAVWGRADVSENLLAQTIVRLRRALGDGGDEQRCIKTMSRVGYRWVADTTIVSNATNDTAEQASVRIEGAQTKAGAVAAMRRPWLRRALWIAPLLILAAALGYWRWQTDHRKPIFFSQGTSIVLPADVDAPEDWKWLQLGLMDLIAGDLRQARVPVESSQAVLDLLNQTNATDSSRFASFALVIHPHVTLADNLWRVHLDANSPDGRTWQAESSSDNVLNATRSANDLLLAQMGITTEPGKPAASDAKEEYLMRIDAASYAGSADAVRELLDKAPPDLRETPEFGYAKAVFHCNQGEYEACKLGLADLLQRLPADKYPVLRGRTLAQQWYIYFREHKYAEGEAVLSEAVQLLQKQKDTGYLAFAYAQLAELEILDGKFDQAASDFGLARVNYTLAGDTAGAYGVDESLAYLSMQRGQFAQALPIIQRAYEQYQRMGMRQFLPDLLQDMVTSRRMLLQYTDELAVTDRYWPFEQKHWEVPENVMRHLLVFERAHALADNGRTTEGSKLLEQLLEEIKLDPKGEPGLQGCVETLLAKLALQRGDIPVSLDWISKTLSGKLLEWDSDKHDYADAWLTNVIVTQRTGTPEDVKRAVAAMQTWVATLSGDDDWIAILLLRAQAAGAWSQGQRDQALSQLKLAMNKADKLGVPELMVDVGQVYAQALVTVGKVDDAAAVSGQLSAWSQLDWRAAWTQACVYRALGQTSSWEQYRQKARELAGDRVLPEDASVWMY
ncbi:winged helix-turn-helix domain-containing protein [Dyella caseinilytica]|uniref:winged helix-turn-helix domain-containing protein n=1 Tax=Dyella caseinilytica TaxID=1849581 RepID=UPI00193F860B|nr:winged helix-turn-helix domain-containing protein [Dyella caseinilytica]